MNQKWGGVKSMVNITRMTTCTYGFTISNRELTFDQEIPTGTVILLFASLQCPNSQVLAA